MIDKQDNILISDLVKDINPHNNSQGQTRTVINMNDNVMFPKTRNILAQNKTHKILDLK